MSQQLETIINELREMREDIRGLGDSLLPHEPVLVAAVDVAKHYNAETMSGLGDWQRIDVNVGDLRKLVAAIAAVRQ